MRYQARQEYEQAIEYYKRAAEIAEKRLARERKEFLTRMVDRSFIIALIIALGIFAALSVYSLANFAHWAQFGC